MVNLTLYTFLFKDKERLSSLEKRYQSLTGGKTFSKPANSKEVRAFNSHDFNSPMANWPVFGWQTNYYKLQTTNY